MSLFVIILISCYLIFELTKSILQGHFRGMILLWNKVMTLKNFKILSRHCYYKERGDEVVYIYSSIIMPRNWTVFRNDDESLMSFLGLEKTKDTLNIY